MLLLASFILGTIIGSFANVFVLRHGTGRSLGGRSSCGSCGKTLSWNELVPVVSWVAQRGRCRSCGARISSQYIIVELVFGAVFALCAYATNDLRPMTEFIVGHWSSVFELVYLWFVSFFLISLSIYDIKHMIIPDGMLAALGAVVLVWRVGGLWGQWGAIGTALIAGLLVALPFFLLWSISRGRWMGLGDVKLAVIIGWMFGILGGFSALVFGVWAGAFVSLAIIGITRFVSHRSGFTMKSEIPFGPFLVAGTLLVLLTGITLETIVFYI